MYRAVVIDDEFFIRNGLDVLIDWESYGIKIVGRAADGEQGLALIREIRPEIAFVDVKMPKVDGLEMIKELRGENNDTIFIIMSGYAEFTYAQQAIDYGVYKYMTKPIDTELLKSVVEKIVRMLDENKTNAPYENAPEIIMKILALIETDFAKGISLNEIAEKLHMDSIYLGRLFKRHVGVGFKDYLAQKRIEEAQKLLQRTNLPVSMIAEKVGYNVENYFRQAFKRITGMSPRDYKRKKQESNKEQ